MTRSSNQSQVHLTPCLHMPNCQSSRSILLAQASQAFQAATAQSLALKPHHNFLRAVFLHSCLCDPLLNEEHHKAIAHLVSLEAIHDSYHHIRAIRQQLLGCSISSVEYSSPKGTVLASSHSDVKAALSSTLQTWFQNAHSSPFLHPPLAQLVGTLGSCLAAMEILEGTFHCPPGIDEYTRNFIEALQFPSLEVWIKKVLKLLWPEDFISH